ncbi:acyltransferase [Oscillibacter sp. MSJ-2]|uniref:Acyltransferase n=1 Tax=Dysosmobacter acutus TaxID=2841504 RepID=A0ABS6FBS6_9FIRM|nr:acyltransferase [Dysosmobacter acutus]MBU5627597.1 acyltransferase [Dysosmobacter acutus]
MDNLRCMTVGLVLVYHVFFLYNHIGLPGAMGDTGGGRLFDVFLYVVYPWCMFVLFLIAGMCARYSLKKRSSREFLKERATKLLIPSTIGLFVYHWIGGYLNIKIGGGADSIPAALLYPISALSGTGPLWFIQMLFLFSVLVVLLRSVDRNDRLWRWCGKCSFPVLLFLVVPIWGAAQIGNLPVLIMYRFGIYASAFLIGYLIFSHERIQALLERFHLPLLAASILLAALYTLCYFGENYLFSLQDFFTNAYLWSATLAILGCGRAFLNRKVSSYLSQASFGLYILHYPVVLSVCYALIRFFRLPPLANYAGALILEFSISFALWELFRRIPVVRSLVLGMRRK